jgi:predicted PolB exonuclease-like 3'-5' exonuclease
MSVLVFDIETIPDIETGKKIHNLDGLTDDEVVKALYALRIAKVGHNFLPHYLQKIVAISLVMADKKKLKVWSLGDLSSDEPELIERFFKGIETHSPTIVSWNGSGFDFPVLHYRALKHGIQAPLYWENGENNQAFKWNNYLNRFHYKHLDLMDVLAGYQNKAFAPLDEISTMLGLPGKMGMSGDKVFAEFQASNLTAIRNYCETDVLNTYCVYLRFELIRGNISQEDFIYEITRLKNYLNSENDKPHLAEFAALISI